VLFFLSLSVALPAATFDSHCHTNRCTNTHSREFRLHHRKKRRQHTTHTHPRAPTAICTQIHTGNTQTRSVVVGGLSNFTSRGHSYFRFLTSSIRQISILITFNFSHSQRGGGGAWIFPLGERRKGRVKNKYTFSLSAHTHTDTYSFKQKRTIQQFCFNGKRWLR